MNTTKHDLIVQVAENTGMTRSDTKIVVEEFLETIARFLDRQSTIEIRGFGTFYTKMRKPRPARNPKTGEVVPLNSRLVPLFKYSGDMKMKIVRALLNKKANEQSLP
jgi:integration host factor subunit beta